MDKTEATEATVTSSVKNWYINFFYRYFWTLWDANWCQNSEFFGEIGVFAFWPIFVFAMGPVLGPRDGENRIPREISCRSHLFS